MRSVYFHLKRLIFWSIISLNFFISSQVYAQPGFAEVQSDVKREYGAGVSVVERSTAKAVIDESVWPNRAYWQAYVRATSTRSVEGHSIKSHRNVDVSYLVSGGRYGYSSALTFGHWLVGVPKPPTAAEVSALISANMEKFFGNYIYNNMTEYVGVKQIIPQKYECFECDNFYWDGDFEGKRVKFKVKVAYSMINNRSLEKREDIFEVVFMRQSINSAWNDIQIDGGTRDENIGAIESKELSDKELLDWECNTIRMKYLKQNAVQEFNKLPKVAIPNFATAEEMIWWTHRFLRKASPQEVEYLLITKLNSFYMSKCGSYILNEHGSSLLASIKKFVSAQDGSSYADHYCEYPKIKHQQSNMVQYYTKTEDLFSRISVDSENGELKFSAIELNRFKEDADIQRLKNVPAEKCSEYAPADWANYSLDEAKVSALFPSVPKKTTYPNDPSMFSLTATKNGVEYTIFAQIISQDIIKQIKQESQRPATAKLWSENFRKALGALGNKDEWWDYKGTQGYKCNWSTNQSLMPYRAILYKDLYLRIWIMGTVTDDESNKFFNSININR